MQKIVPCLWFNNTAEQAVDFYLELFDNSSKGATAYYDQASSEVSGQPAGTLLTADFVIEGLHLTALNGGPEYYINPSISLTYQSTSVEKLDQLWEAFSADGKVLMPYEEYPFSKKYGWVEDSFGVSWQLIHIEQEATQKIVPTMMFTGDQFGRAKEAMELYTSIFDNAEISSVSKYGDMPTPEMGGIDPEAVAHAGFTLDGEHLYAMDGAGEHDFSFSHGFSLMVNCKDQEEVDHFWNELTADGKPEPCGWLQDKFGVSWQIIPTILTELLADPDEEKASRTMEAMLKMEKIEIDKLVEAAGE